MERKIRKTEGREETALKPSYMQGKHAQWLMGTPIGLM